MGKIPETQQAKNGLKLSGSLNNQLKYAGDATNNVLGKLIESLDLLGIQYDKTPKKIVQKDIYFDTRQRYLEKSGCSLCIRETDSDRKMTAKRPRGDGLNALQRTEYEEVFPDTGQHLTQITCFFQNHFPEYGEEPVEEIIRVNNTRHEIAISTHHGNCYTLCFDKFEYYHCSTNEISDPQYEIEVEQVDRNSIDRDSDIHNLSRLLTGWLMGFQEDTRNKYQKGISWLENRDNFENRIFLLFDFVAYSMKDSSIQKQLIRDFTDLIQAKLEQYIPNCAKIPIGDGMILGCPENTNVIGFLTGFCGDLWKRNNCVQHERQLSIRTAMHYGPTYQYTDINGNTNFAGSGINFVARIASQADLNQVLISKACCQYLQDSGRIEARYLGNEQHITVKHGVSLTVRNYYDRNSRVGCP